MNVVLWVLQIVLAVAMAGSGFMKVTQPKSKLRENMGWVDDFSDTMVKVIGGLEILAAIGLVLPAWTGIAPILTPLAATGVVIIMIGAAIVHARRREYPHIGVNVVIAVLAGIVAWGRFGPYAY